MRLQTQVTFTTNSTWTCPAGVTNIIITPGVNSYNAVGSVIVVVPNTTYSIVVGGKSTLTPSTFGTLYSFASPFDDPFAPLNMPLNLVWMDG